MAIAPWTPNPERVRPSFRKLREVKERCEQVRKGSAYCRKPVS